MSEIRKARVAQVPLPDFGEPGPAPEIPPELYADTSRTAASPRQGARTSTGSSSTPTGNTAPTSRSSRASTRGSRRRCSSWGRRASRRSSSATSAGARPARRPCRCGATASRTSACRASHAIGRGRSREILGEEGIGNGSRVGVVGWKTYASPTASDLPSYLVDELRRSTGPGGTVENATDLLIDAADGLRVINDVDQLAVLEHAASRTSRGVRDVLRGLRPGMTEREAVALLGWDGDPALLPHDADGRATGPIRAAQPGRPADRARRPVHGRVRDLGRAQLPRGLRRRGRGGAARADPRLRAAPRRPLFRGGRRVVRRHADRPGRAARCTRSSRDASPTRSSASS